MAKNDDMIKQLMAKVAVQKEALGAKPKVSWKTNGVFQFDKDSHLNLNTVSNEDKLVTALAHLLAQNSDTTEAAKILGVKPPKFLWCGYSVEDWVEDFKMRLSVLSWEARKTQLDATQAKLSQLVSEEARTEMELENIAKSLGV
jgi:hypothetical protein